MNCFLERREILCVCVCACDVCHTIQQDKCYYLFLMYEACRHNVECRESEREKNDHLFSLKS
jgi:hypothetical protein